MFIVVTGCRTTFPNTKESDAMPEVWHTVEYSCGEFSEIAYVKAADPQTAIKIMNHKPLIDVLALYSDKPTSN